MAKRSAEPQVGMLPTRVISNKLGAKSQDFDGQKLQNAGEGAGNPEQSPNVQYIPDLSNPDRTSKVTVFKANDPRLHTDASYRPGDGRKDGTPPTPYPLWPGPHPRGT